MVNATFQFRVEFSSDDPLATLRALAGVLQRVSGVERVVPGTLTPTCPVADVKVHVAFTSPEVGEQLLATLKRTIERFPGAALWTT